MAIDAQIATVRTEDLPSGETEERRLHSRTTVSLPGRISCGTKDGACTMLNISPGGALLRVRDEFDISSIVTVQVERHGAFHARVVWRRNDHLGIKFLDDARRIQQRFADLL